MAENKNTINEKDNKELSHQKHLLPEQIRQLFPAYANLSLSEEEVNALTQSERVNLLNNLDYRKKYQLLRKTDDMVRLLRQMPAEDLFFTVEAAGRTDAMDMILSATPNQLTQIFDITCWDSNEFNEDELLDWIGYMLQIDQERAIRKLRTIDITIITLMLSKYIKVWRHEWSDDRNAEHIIKLMTFDDVYHFEILDPSSPKNERLAVFLKALYRIDFRLYTQIMETLVWELTSNLEEHNFRLRSDRLSDQGYPEYLDAISIFTRVNPADEKKKFEEQPLVRKQVKSIETTLPVFYAEMFSNESFLTKAISSLPEEVRFAIRDELVFLSNKMLVARKSLTDLEKVKSTLDEAHKTTSLGLEYLAENDINRALAALIKLPLSKIFQIGYSLVMDLAKRAADIHAGYIESAGLRAMSLVSSPTREVLSALLRKPPLYYSGADPESGMMEAKPFESGSELERSSMLLSRLEFLFDLHFNVLALDVSEIIKGRLDIGLDPLDPDMRMIKVFLTVFANSNLGHEAVYQVLSKDDFSKFLEKWIVENQGGFELKTEFASELANWLNKYLVGKHENYRYLANEWARQSSAIFAHLAKEIHGTNFKEAVSLSQVLLIG